MNTESGSSLPFLCVSVRCCTLSKLPLQPPAFNDNRSLGEKGFAMVLEIGFRQGSSIAASHMRNLLALSAEPAFGRVGRSLQG
jgi:hypothetical protein